MDVSSDVVKWLKQLGYDRLISPDFIKDIVNPSTAMIWKQLMHNVRPKEEVEHIRKNLFITHMQQYRSNELTCQIKADKLNVYQRKQDLESKLHEMRNQFAEQEEKLEKLRALNKINYIMLENNKQKIAEHERYAYLLKKKSEKLKDDIIEIEEMLDFAKNLTPVEESDETKTQSILETLKECAEKIKKLQSEPTANTFETSSMLVPTSPQQSINDSSLGLLPHLDDVSFNFENDTIKNKISKLLREHNRALIWKILQAMNEAQQRELLGNFMKNEATVEGDRDPSEKEWKLLTEELYGIHIVDELKTRKLSANIQGLELEIEKVKDKIFDEFAKNCTTAKELDKMKKLLEIKQENVGDSAIGLRLRKEIDERTFLFLNTDTDKLLELEEKNRQLKEQIAAKESSLEQKINLLRHYHDCILNTRINTADLVRKLNQFTGDDMEWTLPLGNSVVSEEILTFIEYPLEFNRSCIQDSKRIYYRNMYMDLITMLDLDKLSDDKLTMLMAITENPFKLPEAQIADVIASQKQHQYLRLLQQCCTVEDIDNNEIEMLKKEENKARSDMKTFSCIIAENGGGRLNSVQSKLKELIKIWRETDFGNFVSEKRLYKGESYKHYEQLLDDKRDVN